MSSARIRLEVSAKFVGRLRGLTYDLSALTLNKMSVTRASILDDDFAATDVSGILSAPTTRGSNVRQLVATAGICNAATFVEADMDKPVEIREINGDATDAAILRFAENAIPVHKLNEPWVEVFRGNFNSKTKFSASLKCGGMSGEFCG
jgi:sodium/potassium-transporting ATPase subunit alpha